MSAASQARLTDQGYGLPLRPQALASLSQFEIRHILRCLDLDGEQIEAAEEAIRRVRQGSYREASHA
jgi:hypothetical protein